MKKCQMCGSGMDGQRKDARHCPDCRVEKILRYCVTKRIAVRKCKTCGGRTRSAGEFDLAFCAACLEERARRDPGSAVVKAVTRGRTESCAVCGTDEPRLALDHRVPVCLACAKHPDDQGLALEVLEQRREARTALASCGL